MIFISFLISFPLFLAFRPLSLVSGTSGLSECLGHHSLRPSGLGTGEGIVPANCFITAEELLPKLV